MLNPTFAGWGIKVTSSILRSYYCSHFDAFTLFKTHGCALNYVYSHYCPFGFIIAPIVIIILIISIIILHAHAFFCYQKRLVLTWKDNKFET